MKATTSQSLRAALASWRVGAVTLLSFSSGLPLGLVLMAVPTWMATAGVDIKTIGVLTLAQAPYAFKFLWAPLLDRYRLPRLGRKRGWVVVGQLGLGLFTFALALQATGPSVAGVAALTLLIAFTSATQDIAVDAYCVDALEATEQGVAVGARTAAYRVAMWVSGPIAISLSQLPVRGKPLGWGVTLAVQAVLYLALVAVTVFAPEPRLADAPPRSLREAIWSPLMGFFAKPRALEIAAFLLLYKLADNLAVALVRPFLVQKGYDLFDVGVASGTIGLIAAVLGTFVGGALTNRLGLGRALWVFGGIQAACIGGYVLVAVLPVSRPLMYLALGLDLSANGMGTGAFGVLLMRLTQKRFSATQYALFSSLFALGRTAAGPIAGAVVDAVGWRDFFLVAIASCAPGLLMLQRFVPIGSRELREDWGAGEPSRPRRALSRAAMAARGMLGAIAGTAAGVLGAALLAALKRARAGGGFALVDAIRTVLAPGSIGEALDLAAALTLGVLAGLGVLAYLAARQPSAAPSGVVDLRGEQAR